MKRCPQCEFIYEDDQSLCDMDGILLVLDPRTLPSLSALAVPTVALQAKTHSRNRGVPIVAALMLATVLILVYYVSTQRYSARSTHSPASAAGASNSSLNVGGPTEGQPAATSEVSGRDKTASTAEGENTASDAKPLATKPVTAPAAKKSTSESKPTATQSRSSVREKREDSKVGSFLKKTGRILKKPFKF